MGGSRRSTGTAWQHKSPPRSVGNGMLSCDRNFRPMPKDWLLQLRRDTTIRRVAQQAGLLYVSGVLATVLTLGQQLSTAALLGVSDYGRLATLAATTTLILLLLDVRTWELGTKLLSGDPSARDVEVGRVVTRLACIELALGALAAAFLLALANPVAAHLLKDPDLATAVRLGCIALPIRLLSQGVCVAVLRLEERYGWLAVRSVVAAATRLLLMSGAALLGFGLTGVVVASVIAELVSATILVAVIVPTHRRVAGGHRLIDFRPPANWAEHRRMLRTLWVSASLKGFQLETFLPVAAALTSPAQVGLLRVGLDVASVTSRITAPLAIVLSPRIVACLTAGDRKASVRLLRQSNTALIVLVAPVAGLLLICTAWLLPLLDPEVHGITPVATLLIIGMAMNAISQWVRPAVVGLDIVREQNRLSLVLTALSLAALVVGTLAFGSVGAAGAMAAFLVVYALMSAHLVVRRLGGFVILSLRSQ